jgi:hypothetical protein
MITKFGTVAAVLLAALLSAPSASFAAKRTQAYDPNWRVDQPIPNMSAQFYRSNHKGSKQHKSQVKSN